MTDWALRTALQSMVAIIVQPWAGPVARRGRVARYNPRLDPMSLLQASELEKAYGAQDVLQGISLAVPHQARIALVGPNGIGKSTLLRVLVGLDKPDGGRLQRARNLSIGYLPQEAHTGGRLQQLLDQSLWACALDAFQELRQTETRLNELEQQMADPGQAATALDSYGPLQETFERAGGYAYQAEAKRVLRGLGFGPEQFEQPLGLLSGGERTRALLGRLLLEDPDLLVLDEPTNHLDVEAIEWLEGWLREWPGAAIVVSHDRYFMDRTVDTIWELSVDGLESYRGNYSAYLTQRRERVERRVKIYEQQQEKINRERNYIQRNIAGQNTRQAQGRRTRLERFLAEESIDLPGERRSVGIQMDADNQSGLAVIRTKDLVVGRQRTAYLRVPDLVLQRGECAALLGPNGVGKSTLLKTLVGELPPVSGSLALGAGVQPAYFAQAHEGLAPSMTVLESLLQAAPNLRISQARDLLGRYLFSGADVEKVVGDLSGGERGRLALARLSTEGANLLLLDEPTNHLDIPAQEVLQAALAAYDGTILLVSHDRYLVDELATQIWVAEVQGQELEVLSGSYQDYLRLRAASEKEEPSPARGGPQAARQSDKGPTTHLRLERIETQITDLEKKLAAMASEIEKADDHEKVRQLGLRYQSLEQELQAHLAEWERLTELLEGA
jgi:ATP-binding cassette subfamily F protein 3